MASSSSTTTTPSSQSSKKYEVFISFRGEDTRFNFTSHLHDALRRNHIDTYIDGRLERGDEVWQSLEDAIEDSILFLVILSENYASSTWCLKELSKILDCSRNNEDHIIVMPVFYRVDPSHVRKQSGSYQKAFEEHELKSISKQQLQKWRDALTYAANLSGWHCSSDRDEAELITEIVNCVMRKIGCMYQNENDLKDLVGIHKRMKSVESLFNKGSDNVQFIGIWGMGGVGKTTLAKALFNKWHLAYEGFCFLANVREESKKYGIDALKEKLILKLLGGKDAISPYVMRRLSRKKNFIVLDDVDDLGQLETLAGKHEWFGSGSKILITARDKQVFGKKVDYIYQLEALDFDNALKLFSLNAFRKHHDGGPEIQEVAKEMTRYACGNPLALKVLGSLLYGKNQEAWESQLKKLQKLPCPKINDILKLSFEGLDYEEKNIFLHIACFFNYFYVEEVKKMLDACGYSTEIGLVRLEDKALLDIQERMVHMHPLINEMGRQVVREETLNNPDRSSVLWISNKNSEILKKNRGSEVTEGIIVKLSDIEEISLRSCEVLSSMPNLKFLHFYGKFKDQVRNELEFLYTSEFLPKNLRLLHWDGYPLKSLPTTLKVENLIHIKICNSKLIKLWDGVQDLINLRKIELGGSRELIELPDFSKAIHLEEVGLNNCRKLGSVHQSILCLHSLHCLGLRDCEALVSLTSNTHLKSLSHLDVSRCSRLNKFSVTSEIVDFNLSLRGTGINGELCSSSGHLNKIERLDIEGCESVTSVHKLIDPVYLRQLHAKRCNKVASNLRSTFDEMRALEFLILRDCSELVEVPDNISLLSSLRELDLSGSNIETLPASIKHLTSLQNLYLNGCKRLRCLPQLPPSVGALCMENCISIEILHLPLSSEDGRGKDKWMDIRIEIGHPQCYFKFTNCVKLDGEAIKATEAKVVLVINKPICESATMEYPGERVPEWFMYRSRGCFLSVDLSSIPQPWDGSFIFCAVVSKSTVNRDRYIEAKCFIDGQYACMSPACILWVPLLSDHVVLWYSAWACGEVERKIEENKREAQTNTDYHPLLQVQFTIALEHEKAGEIKECGVWPTSAIQHPSYIQQLQLPLLHPHPNSRKRKYHSLLR